MTGSQSHRAKCECCGQKDYASCTYVMVEGCGVGSRPRDKHGGHDNMEYMANTPQHGHAGVFIDNALVARRRAVKEEGDYST